jgi:hypothetical protein
MPLKIALFVDAFDEMLHCQIILMEWNVAKLSKALEVKCNVAKPDIKNCVEHQ